MTRRGRSLVVAAFLASAASTGCRGCRDGRSARGDAAPASEAALAAPAPVAVDVGAVPAVALSPFEVERDPAAVALPPGCAIIPPVRVAPLPPEATTRFLTGRTTLDALVVGETRGDAARLTARGAVDLTSGRVEPRIPWAVPDRPPLFERTPEGWVAPLALGDGESTRAVLWREHAPAVELAAGDALELVDLACSAGRCAVLTTRARASALPGATLLRGATGAASPAFTRVDLEPEGAGLTPFALAGFDGAADAAWVALAAPTEVALWRVEGANARLRRTDATPFGAYDAVATAAGPLVIAPGQPRDAACSSEGFRLVLLGPKGAPGSVRLVAPPVGVIARPLARGALVAWVAPEHCRATRRMVVHALLVDDDGAPVGAPMAVTPGAGFALATRGDELSLWVRSDHGLTWLRGRCAAPAGDGG
ncbi:MAG: hypothetical protein OZ921_18530 [Sorangiineae bacterium]|nr:hypothetical protein [Polyangiaceae bacterium]MEB2324518.1 hypothetical protein [Sorangiineae bacterium]